MSNSMFKGFLCGSAGKERACNVGDLGSIPGLGRSPGEGQGYPLQCSGLENSTDCMVHGILKSWSRLSHFHSLTMFKVFCLIKKIKVYDLHYNWRCSINKKSWWIESTNFKIYLWNRFFIMYDQATSFALIVGSLVAQLVVHSQCRRPEFDSWVRQLTPVFLPGEF